MAIEGADAFIEELEKQVEEGAAQEEVKETPETEAATHTEVKEEVKEDTESQEQDSTETEEDDALSDDAKRRGKAFGQMRHETREAKERAEKAEREAQELRERIARIEGRMEAGVGGSKEAKQEETDIEPDRVLYPDDWNQWKIKQLEQQNGKVLKTLEGLTAQTTYQNEKRGADILVNQYKSANPKEDYDGAEKFLIDRERANKKLMNPKLTDLQIEQQIEQERLGLFKALYSQGRNPAEVVVQLAKQGGYTPGADKGREVAGGKRDMAKLADNQRRSANLNGGSAAGKAGAPSSDDILNMSFAKLRGLASKDPSAFDGE